jgi:hypothetical protein
MLTTEQRALLLEARRLIKQGKHTVIFFAIRTAFNSGVVEEATDADVLALNDFINVDISEGIQRGGEGNSVADWQRLNGMSRPGDGTVVAERLEWIERLLKKGEAHADA